MNSCPNPIDGYEEVQLAHGGGGRLTSQLLENLIFSKFKNQHLERRDDGAVIPTGERPLATTTDSFVVSPLFFPGGNIGSLAVHGTVNDLAVSGASPDYLSAGLIIEEGFSLEKLNTILESMREATEELGTRLVTGDTKVVNKGKGDGIYINTTGLGELASETRPGPEEIQPGDEIFLNGDVGRHGMSVLLEREGLDFDSTITSDTGPLWPEVKALLESEVNLHCLRDLTRGGLVTNLNELAEASGLGVELELDAVPVREDVAAACEILGLDPLHVACEGRMVTAVRPEDSERAREILAQNKSSNNISPVGKFTEDHPGLVSGISRFGVARTLEVKSGEQLPRIC